MPVLWRKWQMDVKTLYVDRKGPLSVLLVSFLLSSEGFNSPKENRQTLSVGIKVGSTVAGNTPQDSENSAEDPNLWDRRQFRPFNPLKVQPGPQYHPPAVGGRFTQAVQVTWDLTGTQVITCDSTATANSEVDLAQVWGRAAKYFHSAQLDQRVDA